MNTRNKRILALALVALGFGGAAQASTVFFGSPTGSEVDVFSLTGFTTNGADMATLGTLFVTVNFAGGGSDTQQWVTNVGGCTSVGGCGQASGAVTGGGTWLLTETGDTFNPANAFDPDNTGNHPWVLTNTSTTTAITSVVLNGLIGNTGVVFDRDLNKTTVANGIQVGTPNSGDGIDYSIVGNGFNGTGGPFSVVVQYGNIVGLQGTPACVGSQYAGNTPCGDEFGRLTFTFTGSSAFVGTVGTAASWTFFQDTDTVGVPEPVSAGLVGIGLLAVALYRRRYASRRSNA